MDNISPPKNDEVEVILLGGGIGESIIIHCGNNEWIIVDSFINNKTKNPIALDYLDEIGVERAAVKLILATHWHDDHIKGIHKIFQECTEANFLLSLALQKDEFFSLLAQDPLQTLKANTSGVSEFYKCFTQIKERKENHRLIWANQDRVINPPGTLDFFHTLAPSDKEITKSIEMFRELVPKPNDSQKIICSRNPNFTSVVASFGVADQNYLLGADLENTSEPGCGWDHIINQSILFKGKKFGLIKIPHHGSSGAHNNTIWSDHTGQNVVGLVSTYSRSHLPKIEDATRIKESSPQSYCTGIPKKSSKPKKMMDKASANIIAMSTKRFLALNEKSGWISHRFDTSSGNSDVQFGGTALEIDALISALE